MSTARTLAVAAVALAVSGTYRRTTVPTAAKLPKGAKSVTDALDELGITDPAWRTWALWVARGESGWNPASRNRSPGERAASAKMYERLIKQGRWPCARNRGLWTVGSGGLYGQLAPLVAMFLPGHPLQCHPEQVWDDAVTNTVSMFRQTVGVARMLRRKDETPNFLQLRALYGRLKRDPAEVDTVKRRAGYTRTLERAGLPVSFLDQAVPVRVPDLLIGEVVA